MLMIGRLLSCSGSYDTNHCGNSHLIKCAEIGLHASNIHPWTETNSISAQMVYLLTSRLIYDIATHNCFNTKCPLQISLCYTRVVRLELCHARYKWEVCPAACEIQVGSVSSGSICDKMNLTLVIINTFWN